MIGQAAIPAESIDARSWLLCRIGSRLGALPLDQVIEIMRLLPVEAVASAPPYLRGLGIIRGAPVPVVDLAIPLGEAASAATRLVSVRVGPRRVALAVDAVLGVRRIDPALLGELPPLLRHAESAAIAAIGTLDAALLFVLQTGRLVPDSLFAQLDAAAGSP